MVDSITSYRAAMNHAWPGWWVNWPSVPARAGG